MSRLLVLLLLCGPAFAAEPTDPVSGTDGCPASARVEAQAEVVAAPVSPAAPPALKSTDAAPTPAEPRTRTRSRGPAWHSFLPGIFK